MPIKSAKQFGFMASRLKSIGPTSEVAKEMIDKTPKKSRSNFAKILAKKKKK